jgi:hypothetical protein
MPTLQIRVVDPDTGQVKDVPLTAPEPHWEVVLQPLPGATGVHLFVQADGSSARAEIEVHNDDPFPVKIAWDGSSGFRIASGDRRVFILPADERYAPAPPLRPALQSRKADLLFLIDGTTRFLVAPNDEKIPAYLTSLLDASKDKTIEEQRPLTTRKKTWDRYAETMLQFASRLRGQYSDFHSSVILFGDESMKSVAGAEDLDCRWAIHPQTAEQRQLRPFTDAQLRERLANLPATFGGDYVDALAEALHLCGAVGWRTDARCVLALFGDSPGFALMHPPPRDAAGVDIHVRRWDVDNEAMRLYRDHNVEIVSIYAGPPPGSAYKMADPFELLGYTAEQYARLATLRSWAWSAATFEGEGAAREVLSAPAIIGRQSCYGLLLAGLSME